jgi:lipoate-protein ligase A
MTAPLRIVDTGERPARWNVAMTAVLAEFHRTGLIPDTLRFHRYPASVLLGRHQVLTESIHADRCRKASLEVARRVTGGGTVYMAPGALAWDLVIGRDSLGYRRNQASEVVGEAVAAALARLGLPARYRMKNEVEVEGRKICGMSGYWDGGTLVCQGTLLVDTSLAEMAKFLKLPSQRKRGVGSDLGKRLATICDILGRRPDPGEIEEAMEAALGHALHAIPSRSDLTVPEWELTERWYREEFGLDSFVQGVDAQRRGTTIIGRDGRVGAYIKLLPGEERVIDQIWLTGNFSVSPSRALPDLEAALRGIPIERAPNRTMEILSDTGIEMRGASRYDVAAAIANANNAVLEERPESL